MDAGQADDFALLAELERDARGLSRVRGQWPPEHLRGEVLLLLNTADYAFMGMVQEQDVRRMASGVIQDYALPCELVEVRAAGEGWDVAVRWKPGRVSIIHVRGDRPTSLRAALKSALLPDDD